MREREEINVISGHGYSQAKILFIRDSATKDDLTSGKAFSGSVERMMRSLCADAGISYNLTYKTLYIKDRLPGFGFGKKKDEAILAVAREAIAPLTYESILLEEIRSISPNVIVPLGKLSLSYLTGETKFDKFRGSILLTREDLDLPRRFKVIPTFGPLDIFEAFTRQVFVQVDLSRRVKPHSEYPDPPKDNSILWICKLASDLNTYFNRNQDKKWCTLDIETFSGIPTCISFCFDGREAVSVALTDPTVSMADRALLFYRVAKFLASPIGKVGQNIKYDWTILERFGLRVANIVGDTMLAAHTIYPELPKGLDFLTSIYTEIPYYKDEGKESVSFPPDRTYFFYNAKDSLATYRVYEEQKKELLELGLDNLYLKKVMPLFFMYKKIDQRGIRIDDEKRKKKRNKYESIREIEQETLSALVGYKINTNSPDQVARLVYDELKFPSRSEVNPETGGRHPSTKEEILEELSLIHTLENKQGALGAKILDKIIGCRKLDKILQFLATPIHPDGRFRSSCKLHGTETGRTSWSSTIDQIITFNKKKKCRANLGASFQTIPKHGFKLDGEYYGKDVREIFVPSPGCVLIEVDQSQAEARHVAILANDMETLAILEKKSFQRNRFGVKDDLHTITASWVTEKPWTEITPEDRQEKGKPARHGGNYDMTAKRVALENHIILREAEKILTRFHQAAPKIRGVFHAGIIDLLRKQKFLTTPFGRRRDFFGRLDSNLNREGFAHIPQSSVSDHQKFAMLRIESRIPDVQFLAESHDSTLAEVKKEDVMSYAKIAQGELMVPIDYLPCSMSRDVRLVVPVEFQMSEESWGEMRDLKI